MNFSGPEDFKYVTGDLSAIEIDNDIMPVRSGSYKNKLRGMDIAFLMEAVEERARAYDLSAQTFTFTRHLSLQQLNSIIDRYNQIAEKQRQMYDYYALDDGNFYGWVDPLSVDGYLQQPFYNERRGNPPQWARPFLKVAGLSCENMSASDSTIMLSTVSELFERVGGMKVFSLPQDYGSGTPIGAWGVPNTGNGSGLGVFTIHTTGSINDLTQVRNDAANELANYPFYMHTKRINNSCGTGVSNGSFNALSASLADIGQKLNEFFDGAHNGRGIVNLYRLQSGYQTEENDGQIQQQQSPMTIDPYTHIVHFDADDFMQRGAAFRQQYGDFAYPHWTAERTNYVSMRLLSFVPLLELSERTRWDI